MTLLHDDLIDGVRTIWVDSGRPTLAATLLFRAGSADETLASSGWLHLLEHLALHGRDRGSLHANGSVAPLLTTFMLHGPPEQVCEALRDLTSWLAAPDVRELDRERRVLAVEEATRQGGGPVGRAFGMRYGALGPGLVSSATPGLGRASADSLAELARQVFVTGNAALALDGPPPGGLALALPPGDRLPVRAAVPVEDPQAVYVEPAGLVVSGLVPRSSTNTLVAPVVEEALRRQLRDRDGAAYSPYSVYEGVDEHHALVVAGSDVSPSTAPSLLGNTLDLLDGLARNGPDPAPLRDIVDKIKQAYTDPYNVGGLAHRAAALTLQDLEPQELDEVIAELDAATPESLVPGLVELRDTVLMGAPPATAPHTRLRTVEQPYVAERARGGRSANWPGDTSRLHVDEHDLVIGDSGVVRRYALAEVAGYLTWGTGARQLVLQDGWSFTLVPEVWAKGERHVSRLDAVLPAYLHLPQPDDTAPTAEARAGAVQRWGVAAQRERRWIFAGLILLALLAGGWVLAEAVGGMPDRAASRIIPFLLIGLFLRLVMAIADGRL